MAESVNILSQFLLAPSGEVGRIIETRAASTSPPTKVTYRVRWADGDLGAYSQEELDLAGAVDWTPMPEDPQALEAWLDE